MTPTEMRLEVLRLAVQVAEPGESLSVTTRRAESFYQFLSDGVQRSPAVVA